MFQQVQQMTKPNYEVLVMLNRDRGKRHRKR